MKFATCALALCTGTILTIASLPTAAGAADGSAQDWVYGDGELPEKWSYTNEDYAACDAGVMQSPIDLSDHNGRGSLKLGASYGETTGVLKTGPGKVQVDVDPGMGMISGERLYSLVQLHFHTPAEHMLHSKRYPLVAHLVHGTRDNQFAVLGVMFKEGEANEALEPIIEALEADGKDVTLDVSQMVPDDLDIWRYMGSLTTPPCTEGVNWHVADEVLTASPEQIAAMRARLGNSARSLQPRNHRLVIAPDD